ncbi:MAG: DUF1573 domain-containing protein [Bacteroidales bacterium]|jgi:hypothetical protein|nr:DUF1573 domain-containing protein [Bacteroidales bacterium]
MRIFGLFLVFALFCAGLPNMSCNSRQSGNVSNDTVPQKITSVRYDATEHNFGKVQEGEKVSYRFEFTNTGDTELFVKEVKSSCGCTATDHSKEPVAPGKKGFVEVSFDTNGRPGMQERNVLVICNTEPPSKVISFICEVEPKKQQ